MTPRGILALTVQGLCEMLHSYALLGHRFTVQRFTAKIADIVARPITLFSTFQLQNQVLTSYSICSLIPFHLSCNRLTHRHHVPLPYPTLSYRTAPNQLGLNL
jgi:hypothetical protein